MQNDPVTPLALLHNYLATQDPSPATFDYLREQRLVCHATKNHVEHLLGDDNWRAPWLRRAHEFCNDLPAGTALVPGAPLNAGLERMIVNDEMSDLVTGMHEFRCAWRTRCLSFAISCVYCLGAEDSRVISLYRQCNANPCYEHANSVGGLCVAD